jgi:type II secretory pathway predicted ATPase ExeA
VEHLATFGLERDPFANDPDLALFFEASSCADATRRLQRAAMQGKSLCVVSGRGGVGKTMWVRHLLESLDSEMFEACMLVPVPGVSDLGWVLNRFARQLGVEEPAPARADVLAQVYEQLCVVREDGRHAVLIVDEAQVAADAGWLGELRGLLNLEYEDKRLLTLVLVGLPSLASALREEPALADRVDVQLRLAPLGEEEAAQYLKHRVRAAGGNPAILESAAVTALVKAGEGIPRRLNTLADEALFEAHLAGRESATAADVERVAGELGFEGGATSAPAKALAAAPEALPLRPAAAGARPVREAATLAAAATGELDLAEPEIELGEEVLAADTDPRVHERDAGATVALMPEGPAGARRGAPDVTTAFFADEPAFAGRGASDATMLFDDGLEPATPRRGTLAERLDDSGGDLDDLFADLVDD